MMPASTVRTIGSFHVRNNASRFARLSQWDAALLRIDLSAPASSHRACHRAASSSGNSSGLSTMRRASLATWRARKVRLVGRVPECAKPRWIVRLRKEGRRADCRVAKSRGRLSLASPGSRTAGRTRRRSPAILHRPAMAVLRHRSRRRGTTLRVAAVHLVSFAPMTPRPPARSPGSADGSSTNLRCAWRRASRRSRCRTAARQPTVRGVQQGPRSASLALYRRVRR